MNAEMRAMVHSHASDPQHKRVQTLKVETLLADLKNEEAELDRAMEEVKGLLRAKENADEELRKLETEHASLTEKFNMSRMQVTHSRLDLATLAVKRHEHERLVYEGELV